MTSLVGMIIRHEELRLFPYKCTSRKLTIGVGRNLDDNGISEDEAMYMLRNDLSRCMIEARGALPFFDTLLDARQDVIINMVFNLGLTKFLRFKKMIKALEDKNYDKASEEMLDSKWAKQVKGRAIELAQIMSTGREI